MNLTVYTKTKCPWCIEVVEFLNENNIQFEEKNVRENPDLMKELEELSGQTYAPTLGVDGKIYPDSDIDELKKVLKEKEIIS